MNLRSTLLLTMAVSLLLLVMLLAGCIDEKTQHEYQQALATADTMHIIDRISPMGRMGDAWDIAVVEIYGCWYIVPSPEGAVTPILNQPPTCVDIPAELY